MTPQLVLASASPRRVELLRTFGISFDVVPSKGEELHDERLLAAELCAINARRKAEEIARQYPESVVLGADTLVTLDGALFGKPRNLAQAGKMLMKLSGRTHQVITGVALVQQCNDREEVFTAETSVTFKPLTRDAIQHYFDLVPVLDKAGAYGIQDRGEMLVERVSGSLTNVIGLPVEKLAVTFCRWGMITPRERDRIVQSQRSLDPGT